MNILAIHRREENSFSYSKNSNGLFGSLEREESKGEWFPLHLVWMFLKLVRGNRVISFSPYLDVFKIKMERRGNNKNGQIYPYLKMDLQHWSIINLEIINWKIYLVNNLFTLLSLQISPIWKN